MFMKRNNVLIRVLSLAFFARKKGLKIAVAESCTSGLLADLLSSIAGSSAWFDFGVVCYSNISKETLLCVNPTSIQKHGSVSKKVASEMLSGLEKITLNEKHKLFMFLSITGVAGPTGSTKTKPRGLVWFGLQAYGKKIFKKEILVGSRTQIRTKASLKALERLISESARKTKGIIE